MARIPRSVIDAYTRELNAISDENRRGLEDALGRVDWDAPVAVVREQLVASMQMWCGGATDQAAMLASVFYDGVREIAVGEPMGALAESHREPDRTTRAVRAFVQDLVDGKGPEPVRRKCLERLDYEVKRAAAECVDANARRDRKRPRYARVPSGSETCDFCIMLASRGPVYHSERSAGALDHFHANCDCRVVPMWDTYYVGPSRRATASSPVEGYDPDELYERYVEFMTDGKFRDRMARAADRAKGGDGNVSGRETSHPMLWAKAKRDGLVTLGSVKEVQDYIRGATSYEDLFDRIDLVSNEWAHYGLSDNYRQMVQQTMRNTRDRLLGVKGSYAAIDQEVGLHASFREYPEGRKTYDEYLADSEHTKARLDVVEGKSYRRKVIEMADQTLGELLTEDMRRAVKHRSGTRGEDLYAYDATLGNRIGSVTSSKLNSAVYPTSKMKAGIKRAVASGHEVVIMHNHPGSSIPSMEDVLSVKRSGAAYGVIACHDGSIYRFSIVGEPQAGYSMTQKEWQQAFARRLDKGESFALQSLEKLFGVRVEHIA